VGNAPPQQQRDCIKVHAPPGGVSNFAFNDGSGQLGDATDGPMRRHTNGLRRVSHSDPATDAPAIAAHAPVKAHQPPGGRGSFVFNDGSDSLDQHVQNLMQPRAQPRAQGVYGMPAQQLPPEHVPQNSIKVHAPPGGSSSFSIGWGGDNGVNHHRAYHANRQPLRPMAMPPAAYAPAVEANRNGIVNRPPGGASSFVFG